MNGFFGAAACLSLGLVLACSRTYSPDVVRGDDSPDHSSVCAVSKLDAKYYRDVAKQSVPGDIGALSCVVDASEKLQAEAQCANEANTAAFQSALTQRGLKETEHRGWGTHLYTPMSGEYGVGHVIELGPQDAESFGASRAVYLGYQGGDYGCSGSTTLAGVNTMAFVAREDGGRHVVVIPKPVVESRTYVSCTCFAGCGAQPPGAQPVFAALEPGQVISETVEVPYPAISVVTTAVESQTCCCAP
jgi:hypothetical protein